jgi:hypothetical protein
MFAANDYLITIVELKNFRVSAETIFSDREIADLVDFIAANPDHGVIIPGTNGVRKIRWRAKGKGKRGGARIIYYFRDLNMPVFVIAVYAKGEKINLTAGERNQIGALVDSLVREYQADMANLLRLRGKSA